jgi:hypothetical protein
MRHADAAVVQMKRQDSVISNSPSISYVWNNITIKTKPTSGSIANKIKEKRGQAVPGVKTILRNGTLQAF